MFQIQLLSRIGISAVSVGISAVSVGTRRGRVPVFPQAACDTPACRGWGRRQGPPAVTGGDDIARQETCRRWGRRHVPAGSQAAGDTHRLPKRATTQW
jgi:hypothetical protein